MTTLTEMKKPIQKEEAKAMQKEPMVRTSLRLPESLWKRVRIAAIERKMEAQHIVALALEQYLKKGGAR